mgnify:CR=1 FL=1
MPYSTDHIVVLDFVGLNARNRITCFSGGCNVATLVKQPYMTFEQWETAKKEFLAKHPCSKPKNEGWRG